MDDKKKYNQMEKCLQAINGQYISLSKGIKKRNNIILKKVLLPLTEKMKEKDPLFKILFKTIFFGGSYYDGLKIQSPNEYDIDLLLEFPSTHEVKIITNNNIPGFVNLQLPRRTGFERFFDDSVDGLESFLDTNKLLSWIESVVQKALNELNKFNRWKVFGEIAPSKSGPAYTLILKNAMGKQKDISLDLVPSFLFHGNKWPKDGFNIYEKNPKSHLADFFVVPKHPKGIELYESKYWRLSFQIQEKDLIHNLNQLKPALKLLKKLRDAQQHNQISSYFLKTIVLWEVPEQPRSFWVNNSLSYIFMHLLKKYYEHLRNEEIVYFWNENFDLLDDVQGDFINMSNRLGSIIERVNENIEEDPDLIARYILTPVEYNNFCSRYYEN